MKVITIHKIKMVNTDYGEMDDKNITCNCNMHIAIKIE